MPPATSRILLIACGALAREILDSKALNGWSHLDLTCLPANLQPWPDRIPDAVAEAVTRHRADYAGIFVVYADCGTGGQLQARCAELGVEMVAGPHCYSFFEGNTAFAAHADTEFTAFYLTDFPGPAVRRLRLAPDGLRPPPGTDPDDVRQLYDADLPGPDR